jgi:hypothetical protein
MNRFRNVLAIMLLAGLPALAGAAECTAESGSQRIALLELYTSEGCDSCPPADRWASGLVSRGFTSDRVVALAFHVDYWNYLGWRDPYSKAEYSDRQRKANARNRARVVYTPQFLLNGKDYRRATFVDDLDERVKGIGRQPAQARIRLGLDAANEDALHVTGKAWVAEARLRAEAHVYLALYENNLSNQVTAGENRGKRLRHDFVVRQLAGPFAPGAGGEASFGQRFPLQPAWKTHDLHIAAFVQDESTGDVLQSLSLALCR